MAYGRVAASVGRDVSSIFEHFNFSHKSYPQTMSELGCGKLYQPTRLHIRRNSHVDCSFREMQRLDRRPVVPLSLKFLSDVESIFKQFTLP